MLQVCWSSWWSYKQFLQRIFVLKCFICVCWNYMSPCEIQEADSHKNKFTFLLTYLYWIQFYVFPCICIEIIIDLLMEKIIKIDRSTHVLASDIWMLLFAVSFTEVDFSFLSIFIYSWKFLCTYEANYIPMFASSC